MVWCSCFLSEEEKTAIAIDKEINRLLQEQKKREKRELKLLLLGEYFVPEQQEKEGLWVSSRATCTACQRLQDHPCDLQ